MYLRCLIQDAKRAESTVRYIFHLYKIKNGKDGRRVKTVVHRSDTTRTYFDVRLIPEKYPLGFGDTVRYWWIMADF